MQVKREAEIQCKVTQVKRRYTTQTDTDKKTKIRMDAEKNKSIMAQTLTLIRGVFTVLGDVANTITAVAMILLLLAVAGKVSRAIALVAFFCWKIKKLVRAYWRFCTKRIMKPNY